MKQYRSIGLLIIRVGVGISYIVLHGWSKLTGGPEYWEAIGRNMSHLGITFVPVFWGFMCAFSETFGALLLALGLFFRPAATLLAITMCVAVVSHLANDEGWQVAAHALHMAMVFCGFIFAGPGRFSLDAYLNRRKSVTTAYPLMPLKRGLATTRR